MMTSSRKEVNWESWAHCRGSRGGTEALCTWQPPTVREKVGQGQAGSSCRRRAPALEKVAGEECVRRRR